MARQDWGTPIEKLPTLNNPLTSNASNQLIPNKINGSGHKTLKINKAALQTGASIAGSLFDSITKATSNPTDGNSYIQNQVRSTISDAAISSGNPIAMAIGTGTKMLDMIGSATGLSLNNIDKTAAKDAKMGASAGLNNAINYIPGVSMIFGAFARKTDNADVISDEVKDIQGAYGDSYGDLESAQKLSGKRFLFGRRKANKFINEANETNQKMQDIATTNTLRKQSDYGNDIMQQNLNRYAGTNYMYNAVGKQGMKLMSIEQAKLILMMRKNVEQEELQIFANGGAINIIPEGARHSRLNHLDEVHDDFEDVTKKGIPVVTPTEDGDLEQVAEVECGEIIFSKSVTEKLEELIKDGSDEAAIEAGKLLVKEIIKNTDDKTEELL